MFGPAALALLLATVAHPYGGSPDAPAGYLYAPARDVEAVARLPATRYAPQPGDVLLMSNSNAAWSVLYKIAFTGKPGHSAIVARMPDGRPGILEAGIGETLWTKFVPAEERLDSYPGHIWVRRRTVPLTECQNLRLTEFADLARGGRYDVVGFARQVTPFRTRGPLRTYVVGKPRGAGRKYFCAEAVLEGLVYAGLIDEETTRPSATFPRDLFFDDSPNLYIKQHPPLACGWEPPALWTACVGDTAKGKERNPNAK